MSGKTTKKGGLLPRVITAIVAVPILLWALFGAGPEAWLAVVFVATVVGLSEYYAMTMGKEDPVVGAMGTSLGSLLVLVVYYGTPAYLLVGLLTASLAILITVLMSYSKIERAAYLVGAGLGGLLYVALPFATIALLRRAPGEHGGYWVLLLLATVWASDTGAYFTGRAFGKRKLSPVVSPNKTWEGAIGGLVASFVAAYTVVALSPIELRLDWLAGLVFPAAILGQLGDLCESLIKRSTGVKDSGKIIYGHGGILDRVDALIFAGPYVYFFYVFTIGRIA